MFLDTVDTAESAAGLVNLVIRDFLALVDIAEFLDIQVILEFLVGLVFQAIQVIVAFQVLAAPVFLDILALVEAEHPAILVFQDIAVFPAQADIQAFLVILDSLENQD